MVRMVLVMQNVGWKYRGYSVVETEAWPKKLQSLCHFTDIITASVEFYCEHIRGESPTPDTNWSVTTSDSTYYMECRGDVVAAQMWVDTILHKEGNDAGACVDDKSKHDDAGARGR